MREIQQVLRRAGRRLFLVDLPRTFMVTLSIALGGLILARVIERTLGFAFEWRVIFLGAGAGAVLASIVWSLVRRARGLRLARELDERAGLKESLSTALCVAEADDPWSRAVIRTARERALTVRVRRVIPIEQPRLLPLPMCLGVALALIWFTLPVLDLSGAAGRRAKADEQRGEVERTRVEVAAMENELEELLRKANLEEEALNLEEAMNSEGLTPEEIRRTALKELTKLEEKLEEASEGRRARELDAVKDMMRRLKQPGPGPMEEFARALSEGDFAKAREAIDELRRKLESSDLSESGKQRLREQMESLSRQLGELSRQAAEVQRALEKAGMSAEEARRAAADPEALREAVERMQNLSPEQKQQLLDEMLPRVAAAQALREMSDGGASSGTLSDAEMLSAMEGMSGTLSDLEMMQAELEGLGAALGEARGRMARLGRGLAGGMPGQGGWREGDASRRGLGSGGPGQGQGLVPDGPESPFRTEREKSSARQGNGPIIGERLVYGDQIRGEATQTYREAVAAGRAAAAEAISNNLVEREYQQALQRYFDGLLRPVAGGSDEGGTTSETPPPAPPPASSTDANDADGGDG